MGIEDGNTNDELFENNPEKEFWRDTIAQKITEIIYDFDPEIRIVLMYATVDYTEKDTGKKVTQEIVLLKNEDIPLSKPIGFPVKFSNEFMEGSLEENTINVLMELSRRAKTFYS